LTDAIPANRAVSTTIPRREIAAVLDDPEESPELILQVVPADDRAAEPATVTMAWSREDLARLLGGSDGADIMLTFDRDQLAQAVGDVEAHGMRARAAVFSVAAVGALASGASIASAMHTADGGAVARATPTAFVDRTLTDASSGAGYAAQAESSAADSLVTDASSAGGYAAAAETSSADTLRTDASSGTGYAPAPTSGGGAFVDIHRPSTTDSLLAVGLLAIAGATFATRRVGTARPV
jgi:hypothetical protein